MFLTMGLVISLGAEPELGMTLGLTLYLIARIIAEQGQGENAG